MKSSKSSKSPKPARPVILTGMMGSGKTTLGKKLAKSMKLRFVDLDDVIVKEVKTSIPHFFKTHGEKKFRLVEKRALAKLIKKGRLVIATGGGAVTNKDTRKLLFKSATTLWLKAPVKVLESRVKNDKNRPLLGNNAKKNLATLLEKRERFYAKAPITIKNDGKDIDAAVARISKAVQKYEKKGK